MSALMLALAFFSAALGLELPRIDAAARSRASRREMLARVAAMPVLAMLPPDAFAVAPPSQQQMLKSRAIYGSRVWRMQGGSSDQILEEKNALKLFTSGVYGSTADKATRKELEKLEQSALAAAKKGDPNAAQAAIREFVAVGRIEEVDNKAGSYFNPKTPCDRAGLQCGKDYKGYVGSRNEDLEVPAGVATAR